tara:strand:- start:686 stop:985 length:300 start_codon:yes stop_codon:yes gene_type:complete
MITGEKYARGWITMGTYETSGDSLNLANVFKSSTECTVIPAGNDGYQLEATQGRNADNQLIMAYYVGNINAATGPLTQVANAVDLSAVNAQFFAIGQPY